MHNINCHYIFILQNFQSEYNQVFYTGNNKSIENQYEGEARNIPGFRGWLTFNSLTFRIYAANYRKIARILHNQSNYQEDVFVFLWLENEKSRQILLVEIEEVVKYSEATTYYSITEYIFAVVW